jgi:hypothetical protein
MTKVYSQDDLDLEKSRKNTMSLDEFLARNPHAYSEYIRRLNKLKVLIDNAYAEIAKTSDQLKNL